jgi:hypothetical protein
VHSELEHVEFIPLNDVNAFNRENPSPVLPKIGTAAVSATLSNSCRMARTWG